MLHSVDAFLNGAIPVPCTPWRAYFSFPWSLLAKLLVWMPFSSFRLQMSWINKNVLFELVKVARLTWLSWKVSGSSSHRDQVESNWTVLSGRYYIRDMIWFDLIWFDQGDVRYGVSIPIHQATLYMFVRTWWLTSLLNWTDQSKAKIRVFNLILSSSLTVSLKTVLCTVTGCRFSLHDWETLRYWNNVMSSWVGKQ